MCRAYSKMEPLTPEEQVFAEEHHPFLLWCMKDLKIDFDEYYGAAATGYLKAVKNWFSKPELRKYKFTVIAKNTIRGYVGSERKKNERQVQTVSLDEIIRDTDGATRQEMITYDNLNYLKEENMNITYNVIIPERKRIGVKSDEVIAIEGFLAGKMKNMCFEYETTDEAKKKAASVSCYRRKMEHQKFYDTFRIENKIYVVRELGRKKA